MTQTKNLSSLEKLLLGIDLPETPETVSLHHRGELCPKCGQAILDYNGLLQLECSACEFTEGSEGVGCT
ncbi:MAG: hypothetical protein IH589_12690 [Anaerolineales bacterium]|nr:hypothetical protein [Anaerolineales bacterium]